MPRTARTLTPQTTYHVHLLLYAEYPEAGRYIERNPLEAELVEKPELYPWSSYRHTAFGQPDPLVTLSPAYLGLASTAQARQIAWQQYCAQIRPYQTPSTEQLAGVFQGW